VFRQNLDRGGDQRNEPVLESLKTEGRRLADDAKKRAEGVAAERKQQGAGYLKDVAAAVQEMSQSLKTQGHDGTASYVDVVAQRLDQVGGEVEAREFGAMARDLDDFARQRPALFFGGALIAGFGLARFLKSSSSEEPTSAQRFNTTQT